MTCLAFSCGAPRPSLVVLTIVVLALTSAACGGDDLVPVIDHSRQGGDVDGGGGDGDSASPDAGGPGLTTVNPPDFFPPDGGGSPCDCGVFGECGVNAEGELACECVKGYVANDLLGPCVEDLSCVELKTLTCRAVWGGNVGAGNGILLSASYCSGAPFDLSTDDLVLDEQTQGNTYQPLTESHAQVIPRDTTAHLYFAIDISGSITDDPQNLIGVATAIQALLDRAASFTAKFNVSIFLFDGSQYLYEYVPETKDLDAVRLKLDKLHEQRGVDDVSSNVFGAFQSTINRIERSFELKALASRFGVLNTGAVIVISEFQDNANRVSQAAVQKAIDNTAVKVMTIGIGEEVIFPVMASLGRDGSFNADSPENLTAAFTDIGDRLESFEGSLAYIGYCAAARAGVATTRVSLASKPGAVATCTFDASQNLMGCNVNTLNPGTVEGCLLPDGTERKCGGLLACGMCEGGQCCSAGRCIDPILRTVDEVCATERHCEEALTCAGGVCQQDTPVLTDACQAGGVCSPGILACEADDPKLPSIASCVEARTVGQSCDRIEDCASLNCPIPAGPDRMCLPVARMFEGCRDNAICEPGSYCTGNICQPQKFSGNACANNAECRSGSCMNKFCAYSQECLFGFDLDIGEELHTLE